MIGECPKVQWRRARVPLPHCYQQRGGQSTGTAHHPTSSLLPRGAVTPQEWREAPFCPHHSHQATRRESSCPGQASGWALSLQWVGVREVEKPHELQEGPACSTSGSPSHSLPETCCPGSPSHSQQLQCPSHPKSLSIWAQVAGWGTPAHMESTGEQRREMARWAKGGGSPGVGNGVPQGSGADLARNRAQGAPGLPLPGLPGMSHPPNIPCPGTQPTGLERLTRPPGE